MRAPVADVDRPLLRALRSDCLAESEMEVLLARAEVHGLAGVLRTSVKDVSPTVARRELARALDHSAHLALLGRVDAAFAKAGIDVVALKGPLLAERLYATPSARVCSDVDLLIAQKDINAGVEVLTTLGYRHDSDHPVEQWYRAEHHHLHLSHPAAPPVELHFHAYRGFGRTLASEPLLARKQRFASFSALGVLARVDELVYLAVHAGAHRFGRLGWLYELGLLADKLTADEMELAATRAHEAGFARVAALAAELLIELFDANATHLAPLRRPEHRLRVARAVVREPQSGVARSLTRFVYSLALCDDTRGQSAYARRAIHGYVDRFRGR